VFTVSIQRSAEGDEKRFLEPVYQQVLLYHSLTYARSMRERWGRVGYILGTVAPEYVGKEHDMQGAPLAFLVLLNLRRSLLTGSAVEVVPYVQGQLRAES